MSDTIEQATVREIEARTRLIEAQIEQTKAQTALLTK